MSCIMKLKVNTGLGSVHLIAGKFSNQLHKEKHAYKCLTHRGGGDQV